MPAWAGHIAPCRDYDRGCRCGQCRTYDEKNLFGRDGAVTTVAENIPFVGYIASAVHAAAGNKDHAKRAAMKCTTSLAASAAAAAGGFVGGPAGAAAAASLVNGRMMAAEHEVSRGLRDPAAKAGLEHSVEDAVVSSLMAGAGAGAGAAVGSAVARRGGVSALDAARHMSRGYRIVGDSTAKTAGRVAAKTLLPMAAGKAAKAGVDAACSGKRKRRGPSR